MIQNTSFNTLKSEGIQSAVSFGIKDTGLAHIFNVLRNQLYTDKIGAVVREYSANAYDANVEVGNPETPITITLPSKLSKLFKIRDHGRGLSQQDIQDIYCFYGESTKRQSNAFIGQLGLGSKSAFAYGDNFVINSFTDGQVRSYNAFIDPSGIGQIALLSTKDTDEPNGVEIVIPVKGEDANYFGKAIKRYLRFFKVRPKIVGMDKDEYDKTFAKPISVGAGWSFYENTEDSRPMAVMGNIAYPIDRAALKFIAGSETDTQLNYLFNSSIVIDFNIGDLDVAASREGLQYTERTIESIKSKGAGIVKTLVTDIQKQVSEHANSEFAAKKFMSEMDNLVGGFYNIRQLVKKITFKGKVITSDSVDVTHRDATKAFRFMTTRYRKNWNGNVQAQKVDQFQAKHDMEVAFNDLGHYNAGARYARHLATSKADRDSVYLLTIQRIEKIGAVEHYKSLKLVDFITYAKEIAELKAANGFCDEDFTFISQIVLPSNVVLTGSTKAKRTGALMFDPTQKNSWRDRSSWKDCAVDQKTGSGIYIKINNYQAIVDDRRIGNSTLQEMVAPFKGINSASIVGLTGTQLKNQMGSGWVSVESKMREEFDSYIKTNNINLERLVAYRLGATMLSDSIFCRLVDKKNQDLLLSHITNDTNRKVLSDLFLCVNSKNNDNTSRAKEQIALTMMDKVDGLDPSLKTPASDNATKMGQEIVDRVRTLEKKYTMLQYVEERNMRWGFTPEFAKTIGEYLS
jgi:hypothetical protein